VVCDIDADFEGEDAGGSLDVEERHLMARTVASNADVLFVVALPTMKGIHSLVRVLHDALTAGVDATKLVPVLNQAPRSPRARAGLTATIAELLAPAVGPRGLAGPVFLPTRRVDDALRDGVRLPPGLGQPLASALDAVMGRAEASRAPAGPSRVRPGSLGSWSEQAVEGEPA
jgi:hypothetical protein